MARDLRFSPSRLIGLLRQLEEEGLLELNTVRTGRAGRPKILASTTPLGADYLRAYLALSMNKLVGHRWDFKRATADGEYARRLDSEGISSYELFLELNSLARRPGKAPH